MVSSVIKALLSVDVKNATAYSSNLFNSTGSIMTLLKPFIIEPTIFVSNNVKNDNPDLLQRAITEQIDIFCCFYSMAFNVLHDIDGSKAGVLLKKLSTSPKSLPNSFQGIQAIGGDTATAYSQWIFEGYTGDESGLRRFNSAQTLSAVFEDKNSHKVPTSKELGDSVGYSTQMRFFELKIKKNVTDPKTQEVALKDIVIPIAVRAHIVYAETEDLLDVFDVKSQANTFTQRFWKWRSGGISFKEFMFATDLIQQYRDKKLDNKTKVLDILNDKNMSSLRTGLLNDGVKGYEKFFNLYIISGSDAEIIEKSLRGTFDTPSFAQNVLSKLQAMELLILDTEYNMGQMLIHNMPQPSSFSLDKLGKRKENTSLDDLMKSLYMNKPPVF